MLATYPRTRSVLDAPKDSPYALSFGRPVQAKFPGKCFLSGARIRQYDRIRAVGGLGFALEKSIEIMSYRLPTELDIRDGVDPRCLISPFETIATDGVEEIVERVRIGDKIMILNASGGGASWERIDENCFRSSRGRCSMKQLTSKLRRATFFRIDGPLSPEEAADRKAKIAQWAAEEAAQ